MSQTIPDNPRHITVDMALNAEIDRQDATTGDSDFSTRYALIPSMDDLVFTAALHLRWIRWRIMRIEEENARSEKASIPHDLSSLCNPLAD